MPGSPAVCEGGSARAWVTTDSLAMRSMRACVTAASRAEKSLGVSPASVRPWRSR